MITQNTLSKLNEMKLYGMSHSFEERRIAPDHKELSNEDFFGLLVTDEYIYRKNRRMSRLIKNAKFKISSASLEEIDYRNQRGIIKAKIINLQNTEWIDKNQNILVTGPTGVGKTYLACAFGQYACRNGYSVMYYRWPRLFGDILASKGQGKYIDHLKKISRVKLLIIDDFGLNALDDTDRKDFLEVIEDRYMAGSTIITSQLPIKDWHEFIGEETIADAVCDRLFHIAHKFEMKGVSMRKKLKKLD